MAEAAQALISPTPSTHAIERWNLLSRVLFRFAFVYLVLYCWPDGGRVSLLDAIPTVGGFFDDAAHGLTVKTQAPTHALTQWAAVHVFHLTGPVTKYHPTGSGDTTLDYVMVFCFAAIAVFATLLWSLLDRRRDNYRALYPWLRLLVRFTLAFTLLSYGFAKVYPLQFRAPFLSTLTETYGESSPMGILWTFMGASGPYTKFCGSAEVLGGVLLLFRRTTTLGAQVAAAAMLNVAMLNFCYDVPVKLYSLHLLVMSLFLLIPDVAPMLRFFLLQQTARLDGICVPKFERRHLRFATIALEALVICSVLFNNIWGGYKSLQDASNTYFKAAPLYGIWTADSFTGDGVHPAWRQFTAHTTRFVAIRDANGSRASFNTTYDEAKHAVKLSSTKLKQQGDLTYLQPDPQHLVLRGTMNGSPFVAEFHRDEAALLLISRGFHWISEDPFNR